MAVVDVEPRPATNIRPLDVEARPPRSTTKGWLSGRLVSVPLRLGAKEMRRRIWHMTPGLLPMLLWPIPHSDPTSPTLLLISTGIAALAAGKIVLQYRRISRDTSDTSFGCVAGYFGAVLGSLLMFRSAPEISFAVLAILAFGDGSATLGGKVLRGPPLPWNPEKTWNGLLSFVIAAVPMATLLFWRETHNSEALSAGVSFRTALFCCGTAAVAAAFAESLRSKVNDNIRVGLIAVAVLAVMKTWLIGWD